MDRHSFDTASAGTPARPSRFSASGWARLVPAGLVTLVLAIALLLAESIGARPPAALVLELEGTEPGTWTVLCQGLPLSGTVDAQGRWLGTVPDGATLVVRLVAGDPSVATRIAPHAVALHWTFTQGTASRDGMVWGGQAELLAKAHEGDHD